MSEQAKGKTRPEIKGKVLAIMPEWRNAAGTFWKQEIVVETGYRFPNPVKVSFQKEATSHLEGVEEGDAVIVPYALNGRKWALSSRSKVFKISPSIQAKLLSWAS